MRAEDMTSFLLAALLTVPMGRPAMPQVQSMADAALHTLHQPYDVETFGAFRNLMMGGDFTSKVRLDAVMAKHPTVGVGALSDARGEITIYEDKLIASYGKAAPVNPMSEGAALLVVATVDGWQSIPVEKDIAPGEMESFIAVAAKSHGIDPEASFPFNSQGRLWLSHWKHWRPRQDSNLRPSA
jgi:hypothetical protein